MAVLLDLALQFSFLARYLKMVFSTLKFQAMKKNKNLNLDPEAHMQKAEAVKIMLSSTLDEYLLFLRKMTLKVG